jgi:Fe-S cluster biogenesis protein NfuA
MFIQTEETPNPSTLKFLPGQPVTGAKEAPLVEFREAGQTARSPLATRLFEIEGVVGVLLGPDFVAISKKEGLEWRNLKPLILGALMEHFTSGAPILTEAGAEPTVDAEKNTSEDSEIVFRIKELLETRVRPVVSQDGGDIEFDSFINGIVFLRMRGACSGCPSATATLKMGIERLLTHFIPEVQEVRQAR